MDEKDLETLNASVDRLVRITTCDGEFLIAKVMLVSEENKDVIYRLVSTSRESQYEKFDQQPVYRITFQEISSVEDIDVSAVPDEVDPDSSGPRNPVRS